MRYQLSVFFAACDPLLPAKPGKRRSTLLLKCLYSEQENYQRLRRLVLSEAEVLKRLENLVNPSTSSEPALSEAEVTGSA